MGWPLCFLSLLFLSSPQFGIEGPFLRRSNAWPPSSTPGEYPYHPGISAEAGPEVTSRTCGDVGASSHQSYREPDRGGLCIAPISGVGVWAGGRQPRLLTVSPRKRRLMRRFWCLPLFHPVRSRAWIAVGRSSPTQSPLAQSGVIVTQEPLSLLSSPPAHPLSVYGFR